jgi:hypothetical protein
MSTSDLKQEWSLLQNQFDSYEKYSLVIKLVNICILAAAYLSNSISFVIAIILIAVWLQDAIWKTFQSRIEGRLLNIENDLADSDGVSHVNIKAYQFNNEYQKKRPGTVGLVAEYFQQAFRPTVAYPHILLLITLIFSLIF